MKLSDFDYNLPPELIAQHPLPDRGASKLLVVSQLANKKTILEDSTFANILNLLHKGDLLVLNNSKVIRARIFGHKPTGGKIELLIERIISNFTFIAHVKSNKNIRLGLEIILPQQIIAIVTELLDGLFMLSIKTTSTEKNFNFYAYLDQYGSLPLPVYINRRADNYDEQRYQTVFAKNYGSVAAPTAGLHFSQQLLAQIRQKGVHIIYITLHVGSGTFKPVQTENIADHKMHSEVYSIDQHSIDLIQQAKKNNASIIAVGTTSLRTLETIAMRGLQAGSGETDIFITPGFKFQLVDKLITNFHLPKSTLLMLVSAFAGVESIKAAYQHAIEKNTAFLATAMPFF